MKRPRIAAFDAHCVSGEVASPLSVVTPPRLRVGRLRRGLSKFQNVPGLEPLTDFGSDRSRPQPAPLQNGAGMTQGEAEVRREFKPLERPAAKRHCFHPAETARTNVPSPVSKSSCDLANRA